MNILITCGPASVAIDSVRRVTNHSTGQLGKQLAEGLAAGFANRVVCLRGSAATCPAPAPPVETRPFFGNDELLRQLAEFAGWPDVVLHLAALADYVPHTVEVDGREFPGGTYGKLRSSAQEIVVRFRQAPKLIERLRDWFPSAYLVGWKYEVEGTEDEILRLGQQQIERCRLNACVLNGPALADCLILLHADGSRMTFANRAEFVREFSGWLHSLNRQEQTAVRSG